MTEKVLYAELTPPEFEERLRAAPIAYLPLGTLEWHGRHLPIGSDGIQSQGFFCALAREAGGIVLPMLFLGPDRVKEVDGRAFYGMDTAKTNGQDGEPLQLPGSAYWVPDELFLRMLEAILTQLKRAGFRVVVAHGHGPSTNRFRKHIPEWEQQFGLRLFYCWRADDSDGLGIQTDHAAANETSLVMALRPELVQMDNLPKDLSVWPVSIGGQDPRVHASAERGREAIRLNVERMAGILREALRDYGG
jgi:creatinine amidohydrolase